MIIFLSILLSVCFFMMLTEKNGAYIWEIISGQAMRRLFAIALSALLIIGFAPVANAAKGAVLNRDRPPTEAQSRSGSEVAGLTKCSESARSQERAALANTPKDIARFKRYGQAVCGEDGLPHLIVDGRWSHAGELFIPMIAFIYITGIIGWSGRSYLIESRKIKNPWDNEIHIDFSLARRCVIKAAAWPALAEQEWRNGSLLKDDKEVSLNGPR